MTAKIVIDEGGVLKSAGFTERRSRAVIRPELVVDEVDDARGLATIRDVGGERYRI